VLAMTIVSTFSFASSAEQF